MMRRPAVLAGGGLLLLAITVTLVPRKRAELIAELPGESAIAARDYDRYLMREVFNDGGSREPLRRAASRPASPLPTILEDQTARGPRLAGIGNKEQKSKRQILRSTSDELSAQQAQRDLDSYWRHQTQKYGPADVRSPPKPVKRVQHPVSGDKTPDPHANHHSHYRYVRPHSRNDPRAQGVAPWDYRWRRPSSAAQQPYEKFETARKVKTQVLSSPHQGPKTQGRVVRSEMPPLPGSFANLAARLKD